MTRSRLEPPCKILPVASNRFTHASNNQQQPTMKKAMPGERISPSIWQTKPWWCQPWSIVAVGTAVPLTSWLLLHRLWLTGPIALAVSAWWFVFLVLVPRQYADAVRSAQKR